MTSHNFQRVFSATSITLPQLLHHSHADQQGDLLVQKACSQQKHCLSHSHRENDGSRTLLDCSRTKSKGFIVQHHLHSRCMLLQLNFKLLKPTSSSQVRALAVSITPLVVAQRSLPYDKKVVTGNGGGSSVTYSSVSSQLTTFTLAGYSLSSLQ